MEIITQLVTNTPIYIWIILFFIIIKGVENMKDKKFSLIQSLIFPCIFIFLIIPRIITSFKFPIFLIVLYLIALFFGGLTTYFLSKNIKYYVEKGEMFQTGSSFSLIIAIIIFLIQYVLNVFIATNPELYNDLYFNLGYGAICGFTIGLFIGRIIRAIKAQKRLLGSNTLK